MRLLVTRPQPEADHLAAHLRELGHAVDVAPLTDIETIDFRLPTAWKPDAGLLATSANAFRGLRENALKHLEDQQFFCVGTRTKDAGKFVGLAPAKLAASDTKAFLSQWKNGNFGIGKVIYLAGRDRMPNLEDGLREVGIDVKIVETYRADAVQLPLKGIELAEIEGVLLFSVRAARLLVQGWGNVSPPQTYCLSQSIVDALPCPWRDKASVSNQPNQESLLSLLEI